MRFVPAVDPPGGQRFDFVGAGAFFVTLLSVMLGLTLAQDLGFAHGVVVGLLVLFVVALAAFVTIERQGRAADARPRPCSATGCSASTSSPGGSASSRSRACWCCVPFYLQNVLGYDVRTMGQLLAIAPIALGLAAPLSGSLSDRIGPRPVLVFGLAIMVVAYLGLSHPRHRHVHASRYILLSLPIGLGIGIFQSPNNSAVMGAVPPQPSRGDVGDADDHPDHRSDHRHRRARDGVVGAGRRSGRRRRPDRSLGGGPGGGAPGHHAYRRWRC